MGHSQETQKSQETQEAQTLVIEYSNGHDNITHTLDTPAVITGDEFHESLRADNLNPRAREIADTITGAKDNRDRIGGLYEYAYRAALAGMGV